MKEMNRKFNPIISYNIDATFFPDADNPRELDKDIWYQQDGDPPYYDREVRAYLDQVMPNRWIGRSGVVD